MRKIVLLAVGLLVIVTLFAPAEEPYRPYRLSISPQIDIPLPPDSNLFQVGGGVATSLSYALPSFRLFSVGVRIAYHLGRLNQADLGNLGSLSVISVDAIAGLQHTIGRRIDASLSGGIGLRATPMTTIGVQGEYRWFRSLYHIVGCGLGVDLRLGGS